MDRHFKLLYLIVHRAADLTGLLLLLIALAFGLR